MLSVLPRPTSSLQAERTTTSPPVQQFDDLHTALEPFAKLIISSARPVKLHCALPTCPPPDFSISLDDLHDLHNRSLYFVHNLLNYLRASGIQATYQIAPSSTDIVLVRALGFDQSYSGFGSGGSGVQASRRASRDVTGMGLVGLVEVAKKGRRDVTYMAAVENVPTLVIT